MDRLNLGPIVISAASPLDSPTFVFGGVLALLSLALTLTGDLLPARIRYGLAAACGAGSVALLLRYYIPDQYGWVLLYAVLAAGWFLFLGSRLARRRRPIMVKTGEKGSRNWETSWRVIHDSDGRETLFLQALTRDEPEDLRCVVIEPNDHPVYAKERRYKATADRRNYRQSHLYPSDFPGAHPLWPPKPGKYEVRWLALRTAGKGALKPLERVFIAGNRFQVHPDGRIEDA